MTDVTPTSKMLCALALALLAGCSRSPTEVVILDDGSRCETYDGRDGVHLICQSQGTRAKP